MNIKMHRSPEQKYAVIEISTSQTKILLDEGINLEENEVLGSADITPYNFCDVEAVFLSHYRADHITLVHSSLENVPVYAGEQAGRIISASKRYKGKKPFAFAGYYENGVPIKLGDIKVTPFLVDNDEYDGYLLLIEGDGKKVVYTGDYRANGRKRFEEVLVGLPKKVDVIICERGVISDDDVNLITERDIEEQAAKLIGETKGPVFVLHGVTDFDRAATIFQAAKRNKRTFLEDLYMSQLASALGRVMPNPAEWIGVKAYLTTGYKEDHFRYKMYTDLPRLGKAEIMHTDFVMCIRPSMKKYMKSLLQSMNCRKGIVINALPPESWKNSAATQEFLAFLKDKGLGSVTLRNSGHSDAMALKALVEATRPAKLLPVHVHQVRWLRTAYPKIQVIAQDSVNC